MRTTVTKLAVALLTLAVGAGAAFFWVNWYSRDPRFDEVDIASLPTIDYCELRNNPNRYSGKVVRINAKLYWFRHGYFLLDHRCSTPRYDSLLDDGRTSVSLNPEREDQLFNFLNRVLERAEPWTTLEINTVGRFKLEYPRELSDSIDDRTSFHLEIYSIDRASRDDSDRNPF